MPGSEHLKIPISLCIKEELLGGDLKHFFRASGQQTHPHERECGKPKEAFFSKLIPIFPLKHVVLVEAVLDGVPAQVINI